MLACATKREIRYAGPLCEYSCTKFSPTPLIIAVRIRRGIQSSDIEQYYTLKGLDSEDFGIETMYLYVRRPAVISPVGGMFWDGPKAAIWYAVRIFTICITEVLSQRFSFSYFRLCRQKITKCITTYLSWYRRLF
jgi:hypothetical protein